MSVSLDEPGTASAPPGEVPEELFIVADGTSPLRSELYGLERLEAHARRLATACELAPLERRSSPLLKAFAANEQSLVRAHRRIVETQVPP
jgi:hypothetical protein